MNLHAIVAPAINAINPFVSGTLKVSTGSTRNADYSQTPTYATFTNVPMQIHALSGPDIKHLDSLNIQGVVRKAYLNGNVEGLNRPAGKGGDILIVGGNTYLVTVAFETWDADGWCSVGLTLQNN